MESGTTLAGRYIIREVGPRSECGDFYLAQNMGSGLLVAMQTLPEWVSRDARWLADVRHRVSLLQTLDHPHIAKLHALEYDPGQHLHFLVREHVVGVCLRDYRLSRPGQRVAIGDAVAICHQIADALDYAHRSILHRHLRPENIILTPDGHVKLWNFDWLPDTAPRPPCHSGGTFPSLGADPPATDREGDSLGAGTLCYQAPEQCADPLSITPASDRWSLAVLFYELVAGRLPFESTATGAMQRAIGTREPAPIRGLGRRRNRALARALAKDPDHRFSSAHAFIEAMEGFWLPRSVAEIRRMAVVVLLGSLLLPLLFWAILLRVLPTPIHLPVSHPEVASEEGGGPPDPKTSPFLQIESRPTGAMVVLDGKRLGITPFTVGRVAAGAYHLGLEKAAFKPVEMEIDLTQDTTVSLNLEPVLPSEATGVAPRGAVADAGQAVDPERGANGHPEAEPAPAMAPIIAPLAVHPVVVPLPIPAPLARDHLPPVGDGGEPVGEKPVAGETASAPQSGGHEEGVRAANRLIVLANEAIKAGYLTQPPGRNACEKLQSALTLDPHHPGMGKSIGELVARYLLLVQSEQTPQPLLALLERAATVLPEDPDIMAARRALSVSDRHGSPNPSPGDNGIDRSTPDHPQETPAGGERPAPGGVPVSRTNGWERERGS